MNLYRFFLDEVPPSINGAYAGKAKRYLSPKVKKFKKYTDQEVIKDPKSYFASRVLKGKRLKFDMYVVKTDWYTKDGRIKKNDITNRIKIFEDAVMEALGLDDSHVWSFQIHKVSDILDATYCEISEIHEDHKILLPDHLVEELEKRKLQAKDPA